MQLGPTFGYINGNDNMDNSIKVTGTAYGFDVQIGGAMAGAGITYYVIKTTSLQGMLDWGISPFIKN